MSGPTKSTLASIVVLATAYPTQGIIVKCSNVGKREGLDGNLFNYNSDYDEKCEELDGNLFNYNLDYDEKREELDGNLFNYNSDYDEKREELDADDFNHSSS